MGVCVTVAMGMGYVQRCRVWCGTSIFGPTLNCLGNDVIQCRSSPTALADIQAGHSCCSACANAVLPRPAIYFGRACGGCGGGIYDHRIHVVVTSSQSERGSNGGYFDTDCLGIGGILDLRGA